MFQTGPLSVIRNISTLYVQQVFVKLVTLTVCQRGPDHASTQTTLCVEYLIKIFQKQCTSLALIIRICHDAWSSECHINTLSGPNVGFLNVHPGGIVQIVTTASPTAITFYYCHDYFHCHTLVWCHQMLSFFPPGFLTHIKTQHCQTQITQCYHTISVSVNSQCLTDHVKTQVLSSVWLWLLSCSSPQ